MTKDYSKSLIVVYLEVFLEVSNGKNPKIKLKQVY